LGFAFGDAANRPAASDVRALRGEIGVLDKAGLHPRQLSGGRRSGWRLRQRSRLVTFDEATSALDPELKHDILGECVGSSRAA
jgi:ABC-type polar amino acid transport system ATPase subunit